MADEILDTEKEKARIRDFLSTFYYEDDAGRKVFTYSDQIMHIAEREQVGLFINLDDIYEFDAGLVDVIRGNAQRYHRLFSDVVEELIRDYLGDRMPPVRDALDAFIFQRVYMDRQQQKEAAADSTQMSRTGNVRNKYPPELMRRFEVAFKSRTNEKPLSVRDIKAAQVGKLITVRGVVIRATEVKPMASVITYTCDTCGSETYQPVSGLSFVPAVNCPSRDCVDSKAHGRLLMQVRGSKFVKFQELRIQEMHEQVPVGSIPRSLTINVHGENTRLCQPGDVVNATGVVIPYAHPSMRNASSMANDVLFEAYHIENVNAGCEEAMSTEDELTEEEIELVSQDNFYDILAYSIAPEIYGHLDVKKTLLLALVGGVDKTSNGMKIRGCINILLMGDPGVAKSQLLSYVDRLAVRSQYTTGRGSSGVGLTAAVMKDPISGEMILEGGALVLSDRGICCIDEFDKMLDADRTAIHEVMEQQTISIAKAGIVTTLNARVSIIAAANPAFGRYNAAKTIEQNVDLPAALLSRFDLIWLIQDKPDRESDRRLAEHITYVHMKGHEPEKKDMKPLDMQLIRRYISVCKRKQPIVEEKLKDRLVEMYIELRKDARNNKDSMFTSPRSLLAIIRMSTALARLRLSDTVHVGDIEEAIRLVEVCKASLRPEPKQSRHRVSPVDMAFSVIRDLYHASSQDQHAVPLQDAFNKCASKGIHDDIVQQCIDTYTANGVFMLDRQKSIIFTVS